MRHCQRTLPLVRDHTAALLVIVAIGMVVAGFVGIGVAHQAQAGRAQFELQVEEGIGSFDRLPLRRSALHVL